MSFYPGDRVKVKGVPHKGTILSVDKLGCRVLLDKGTSAWHKEANLIRLVKKKKPLGVKEYEQISERATNAITDIDGSMWRIKSVAVTRQQLATAWNKFVWGNSHTHASESILFKESCKEIGLAVNLR